MAALTSLWSRLFADFSRIWAALPSPLRRAACRVFVCIFVQAILEVASILSISFLALSIAAPEQLLHRPAGQLMLTWFPGLKALEADPRFMALASAGGVVALIACKNAMFAYVSLLGTRFGERLALYAGRVLFRQYLYSPYTWHLAGDSVEMFQALSWRTALASMTMELMDVYTYFTITLSLCLMVVAFTPKIILLIMIFLGVIAFSIYKLLRRRMQEAGESAAEWGKQENRITLNAMRGIREALIYQQQAVFFEKFSATCKDGMPDRAFLNIAPPIPTWILETAGFFVIFASVFLMIEMDNATMAQITAVVTIIMLTAWRVLPLLNRALRSLISIQGTRHPAMQCLERVEHALANPALPPAEPDEGFVFRNAIELRNVIFRYAGTPTTGSNDDAGDESDTKVPPPSLRGVSLEVRKGSRVGIIGRSGAGKSTLTLLLSGLAPPDEGEMLVDGAVLEGGALAAYRRLVGFVPQNPYIMGGSIAENVAFCQWGRPWDEEKVRAACRMAEFDVALQRGIDAPLGQDGAGLSGGQAQRLSIARALYAEPAILIFDEATSALDSGVEKAIMKTILALPRAITTITIAHRLDTVRRCDTIYWIEDGEVRESGPPEVVLPHYEAFLEQHAAPGSKDRENREGSETHDSKPQA